MCGEHTSESALRSVSCSAVGWKIFMSWSRPLVASTGMLGWGSNTFIYIDKSMALSWCDTWLRLQQIYHVQSVQSSCLIRPVSTESENPPVCPLLAFRWQCVRGVRAIHVQMYIYLLTDTTDRIIITAKKLCLLTYLFEMDCRQVWYILLPLKRERCLEKYKWRKRWR